MKQASAYGNFVRALLAAGLLLAVSGCAWVRDDPDALLPEGSNFRMSLTVLAPSSALTRADRDDDYEQTGTIAENYIDFADNDFRIALFDAGGNYLMSLAAGNQWEVYPTPVANDFSAYQMECELQFPERLTPETIESIRQNGLSALVLANWQSAGGANTYAGLFTPDDRPQPLAEVWADDTHYNFDYHRHADGSSWRPSQTAASKRLIPMFGYAKTTAFTSGIGGVLNASATIPMQRALAKVEVLDNLKDQPNLHVEGVTMTMYNTSARFIPDVAANQKWNQVGTQVTSSSLPKDVVTEKPEDGLSFFKDESGKKWVAYVPEMLLPELKLNDKGEVVGERPHLDIKIGSTLDFYTGGTYPAHFARYTQDMQPTVPDPSWNHILRNHIYRFEVNKVGLTVDLHLHVIPWEPDEDEVWDYTDQVTIQHSLSWEEYPDPDGKTDENGNVLSEPSYASFDSRTGDVFLWLDPKRAPLKGSFKITTPLNGRWYVRLVPIDGSKTDAVTFVDVDSDGKVIWPASPCLEISGTIDNGRFPDYFYIMPTSFDNDFESRYRLEFYVENLGVWTEVPMTPDQFRYYTIVRQRNLIVE